MPSWLTIPYISPYFSGGSCAISARTWRYEEAIMLLEFRVSNYKSIRDEVCLSLVASRSLVRDGDALLLDTDIPGIPNALPVAAILGPNGAGKTNIISSMLNARSLIVNSAKNTQKGEKIKNKPYKLSRKSVQSQTKYEIVFIYKEVKYEFGFSFDQDRIWEEYLFSRKLGKGRRSQCLYQRDWMKEKDRYNWYVNQSIKGHKDLWIDATRSNSLFLSTAVQLNSDDLSLPFEWFSSFLRAIDSQNGMTKRITADICSEVQDKENVLKFMRSFDIDLESIIIEEKEVDFEDIPELGDLFKRIAMENGEDITFHDIKFIHIGEDGEEVLFQIEEESTGTQALFSLSGPILMTLKYGYCLLVDELNTSLHPSVLRKIIEIFSDPKINRNGAQLIFTTHDSSVLSEGLLERDQIWLVERPSIYGTTLTPLTDFRPRKGEALQRRYLSGRYGGVPVLSKWMPIDRATRKSD